MSLSLHLFLHVFSAFLVGVVVWKVWGKPLPSFAAAFCGGILVDFDHFIDYFLAFGWNFHLSWFASGYQFTKSDKMYVLFHGWEYVIILIILAFIFKNKIFKSILLALGFGLFVHLCLDVVIDKVPIKSYFVSDRIKNNFEIEKLNTPEHYLKHLESKEKMQLQIR